MSVDILYYLCRLNFIEISCYFVNMHVRCNGMVIWDNMGIDASTSDLAPLSFYLFGQCYFQTKVAHPHVDLSDGASPSFIALSPCVSFTTILFMLTIFDEFNKIIQNEK